MRVLLIDDHVLFREGLALLLRPLQPDLQVVEAGRCDEAFALISSQGAPDLVLIDLGLPGMPGLEGIAQLHRRWPDITVVALSSADDRDTVLRAIEAGAMGFVPKSTSSAVLLAALKLILARGVYLPPAAFLGGGDGVMAPLAPPAHPVNPRTTPEQLGLTPRQVEVLYLLLQGKPAKRIESELGLSTSTVKAHTSAVLRALNVTTRTQAVVAAGRLGLQFLPSIA